MDVEAACVAWLESGERVRERQCACIIIGHGSGHNNGASGCPGAGV